VTAKLSESTYRAHPSQCEPFHFRRRGSESGSAAVEACFSTTSASGATRSSLPASMLKGSTAADLLSLTVAPFVRLGRLSADFGAALGGATALGASASNDANPPDVRPAPPPPTPAPSPSLSSSKIPPLPLLPPPPPKRAPPPPPPPKRDADGFARACCGGGVGRSVAAGRAGNGAAGCALDSFLKPPLSLLPLLGARCAERLARSAAGNGDACPAVGSTVAPPLSPPGLLPLPATAPPSPNKPPPTAPPA